LLLLQQILYRVIKMDTQELIKAVKQLIKTPAYKDGTDLEDWIVEGDTNDMTPAEIAGEWDDLPEMESDL